ncbi:Uma2 family endonuclease [Lichenibacterium dinghuense]|uniref:Uma2 family endonuclease n=1 Tax=Lichenibacterium dinghuense TaxID=2895977 RepID=UPI001F2302AA|nr:Uma2 family endonuclease [Lichenibacterium sp. 6Y81]
MSRLNDQFDYMSLDDFEELLADKPRDEKWELIGGRVVKMMTGARWEHHFIVQNMNFALSRHLRESGSPCRVFTESFRLKEDELDSSLLPNVIVRCGPMVPGATSLNDPTILVEVMSYGSVGRDRVEKWRVYQKLASLQHYVLVERDKPVIEVFDRAGEAWFSQRLIEGLDATLHLSSLDLSIPLAEIYRDVLKP